MSDIARDGGGSNETRSSEGGPRFATAAFTALALFAFAANSLLTRMALGARAIDAGTFTALRLSAGALVLCGLVRVQAGSWADLGWRGARGPLALLLYAAPFSFAYLRIGAAIGALVLFGVVQLSMIGYGIARGERPAPLAWLGILLAAGGLAALTVPAAHRPDLWGVALMTAAGIAWSVYSIAGRTEPRPVAANARAFLWSCPLAWAANFTLGAAHSVSTRGIALALISGGLTSGLGYAIWYRALPRLTVTEAAVAQLSVPIIAALGAALVLNESLGTRLVLSGGAVLLGVTLVLSRRSSARVARAR